MNDIAPVTIKTIKPFIIDHFRDDKIPESFILIDDSAHETLAARMII